MAVIGLVIVAVIGPVIVAVHMHGNATVIVIAARGRSGVDHPSQHGNDPLELARLQRDPELHFFGLRPERRLARDSLEAPRERCPGERLG